MKKVFYLGVLFVFGTVGAVVAQSRSGSKRTTRLYEYVQQYDTLNGRWRDLQALARLECDSSRTSITLWNQWGHERINPLFRVWTDEVPQFDGDREQWIVSASMRRAKGANAQECTIASEAIIALSPCLEFWIRTPDNTVRYRISQKPIVDDEY